MNATVIENLKNKAQHVYAAVTNVMTNTRLTRQQQADVNTLEVRSRELIVELQNLTPDGVPDVVRRHVELVKERAEDARKRRVEMLSCVARDLKKMADEVEREANRDEMTGRAVCTVTHEVLWGVANLESNLSIAQEAARQIEACGAILATYAKVYGVCVLAPPALPARRAHDPGNNNCPLNADPRNESCAC